MEENEIHSKSSSKPETPPRLKSLRDQAPPKKTLNTQSLIIISLLAVALIVICILLLIQNLRYQNLNISKKPEDVIVGSVQKANTYLPQANLKPKPCSTSQAAENIKLLGGSIMEENLILSKEYNGIRLNAYRIIGQEGYGILSDFFLIVPIEDESNSLPKTYIVSSSSTFFNVDKVFAIVSNSIYVVNSHKNIIDVYEITDKTKGFFIYKEFLDLPRYKVGTIYGISCNNNECEVSSAFHQEGGCKTSLNLLTKKYTTIPKCNWGPTEFTPEPL